MGIEQLLKQDLSKHFNPLNKELDDRTPKYCSWPIKALKFVGLGGIVHALASSVLLDANPYTFIKSGLVSVGIYLSAAAADYLALRRANKKDRLKRRIRITNEYQEFEDEDDYEEEFEDEYQELQEKEILNEMLERYPLLQDPEFLEEFPEIIDVAYHIYSEIRDVKEFCRIWNKFPFFGQMELTNLGQYIDLLRQGNPKAVREYETLIETEF